jgi:hypothetical protein
MQIQRVNGVPLRSLPPGAGLLRKVDGGTEEALARGEACEIALEPSRALPRGSHRSSAGHQAGHMGRAGPPQGGSW